MFRSFAIRLNNDKKDPSSALFVTKRLQSVSGFSSDFYSQLLEDERKLLELVDEENLFLDLSPHLDKLKTLSKEAKNCTGSALEEKLNQYMHVPSSV